MLPILLAAVLFSITSDPNISVLAPDSHDETTVAVSHSTVVVAAIRRVSADQPAWIDVFVSNDGGGLWSAPIKMPTTIDGVSYGYETDPSLATFDDGSFGLTFLALKQWPDPHNPVNAEALVFTRSADGREWSTPQVLLTGPTTLRLAADRPFLVADPIGKAYLMYTSSITSGERIMISSSTDRGAHWSTAAPIPTNGGVVLGQLVVTGTGTLVVTADDSDHTNLVRFMSLDGGGSWSDQLTIGTNIVDNVITPNSKTLSPPISNLAAHGRNVYCVYPTAAGVFYVHSSDDGLTWSTPLQLGGATGDAVLPTVAVDDVTGEVFVSCLDWRDDVAKQGTLRLYGMHSTDGGNTFSPPRAFSSDFNGGGRMGDINGMAAVGRSTAMTAFSNREDTLFVARVGYPPPWHRAARHLPCHKHGAEPVTLTATQTCQASTSWFGSSLRFS